MVHTRLALAPFRIIAVNLVIMQYLMSFLCIRNKGRDLMYNDRVPTGGTDSKILLAFLMRINGHLTLRVEIFGTIILCIQLHVFLT